MILILLLIFILILYHPSIVASCVIQTSILWFETLVPILYPSFILLDCIYQAKGLTLLSTFVFPIFHKIFRMRYPQSSGILLLAFICGAPGSTKLIQEAYQKEEIDSYEANTLLFACSSFSLSYTIYILNRFSYSILLYFILVFFSSILIFRFRNRKKEIEHKKISLNSSNSLLSVFLSSTQKNIGILFSILGIMIFFNILLTLFKMNPVYYSFFEILNGHNLLYSLPLVYTLKCFLLISSLSFLGISLHIQIISIFPDIKYTSFFIYRFIQSILLGLFYVFFVFIFF